MVTQTSIGAYGCTAQLSSCFGNLSLVALVFQEIEEERDAAIHRVKEMESTMVDQSDQLIALQVRAMHCAEPARLDSQS